MTDTCKSSGQFGPYRIVYWRCCRTWPIALGEPVGRCGLCHQRPGPNGPEVAG